MAVLDWVLDKMAVYGHTAKQAASVTVFDNLATPAQGSFQTTENNAAAVTDVVDLIKYNFAGWEVEWVQNTCPILHVVPQVSMDNVKWVDDWDSELQRPAEHTFNTPTNVSPNRQGAAIRAPELPWRYARCRVWGNANIGAADRVIIRAVAGRR